MVVRLGVGYQRRMADQEVAHEPLADRQRLDTELGNYVAGAVFPDSVEGLIEVAYTSNASAELMSQLNRIPPGTWLSDERDLWTALGIYGRDRA